MSPGRDFSVAVRLAGIEGELLKASHWLILRLATTIVCI